MKVHFINPFQFGDFREWDCLILDDTDAIVYRVGMQFRSTDPDSIIEEAGTNIFNAQGYDSSLTIDSITIDKPEDWDN